MRELPRSFFSVLRIQADPARDTMKIGKIRAMKNHSSGIIQYRDPYPRICASARDVQVIIGSNSLGGMGVRRRPDPTNPELLLLLPLACPRECGQAQENGGERESALLRCAL